MEEVYEEMEVLLKEPVELEEEATDEQQQQEEAIEQREAAAEKEWVWLKL